MECLFCKIIKKELPSDIDYEDEKVMAFKDIHPKAPFHLLIVPKKHIESIARLKEEDRNIISYLIFTAKKIAEENNLKGYKLLFNVGRTGGQLVDHLHLHLLSGRLIELS